MKNNACTYGFAQVIADVRERLDSWRKSRPKSGRIPEPLRKEAAALAVAHGISPVARALRLDYCMLKRQIEGVSGDIGMKPEAQPAFVEVALSSSPPPPVTCSVEMERADGARMRVQLSRQNDLLALSDSFWRWRA